MMSRSLFCRSVFLILALAACIAHVSSAELDASNTVDHLTANVVRGDLGSNPGGDLQLSLPIMVVPGRNGLDFPIYLSYQSGIRWKQEATWVGLGFSLQIGSVTRSAQLRVDEQKSIMFPDPPVNGQFYLDHNYLQAQGQGAFRSPGSGDPLDRYALILADGTHPLEMIIDENDLAHCYFQRWNGWHMGFNEQGGFNTYDSQNLSGFIPNFVLRKTDGTRWRFGHKSNIKILSRAVPPQPPLNPPHYFEFPISWDLSDIRSPDYVDVAPVGVGDEDLGAWIKVIYDGYAHGGDGGTPIDYGTKGNVRLGESTFGQRTLTAENGVTIWPSFWTYVYYDYSCVQEIVTPSHIATFYTSPRVDYVSGDDEPKFIRRLDRIDLSERARPDKILRSVQFAYATVTPDTDRTWIPNERLKAGCLTLVSVTIDDHPPMTFEYAANPNPDSAHISDSDFVGPRAYNLSAINVPTGGRVEYEWEPSSYNWFYETDGESYVHGEIGRDVLPFQTYYVHDPEIDKRGRLSSVTQDDGMGGRAQWTFEYGEGTLCMPPASHIRQQHETQLSSLLGFIGYRSIKTNLPGNAGSTINYFTNASAASGLYLDYIEGQDGPSPQLMPGESCADLYENYFLTTRAAERGLLLKQEILAEDGNTILTRAFGRDNHLIAEYREPPVFPGAPFYGWNWFVHQSVAMEMKTEHTWQDGLSFQVVRDFNHENGLPWREIETGSDGKTRWTYHRYAFEDYPLMAYRGMLSQPRMTSVHRNPGGSSEAVTARRFDWDVSSRLNDVQAYPGGEFEWREKSQTVSFGGAGDPDFEQVAHMSYDDYGNLSELTDPNGVTTKTVYTENSSVPLLRTCPDGGVAMADDFENRASGIHGNMAWTLPISGGTILDGLLFQSGVRMYASNHTAYLDTFRADVQIYLSGSDAWGGIHFGTTSDDRDVGILLKCHEDGVVEILRDGTQIASADADVAGAWESLQMHRVALTRTSGGGRVEVDGVRVLDFATVPGTVPLGYVNLASEGTGAAFDNYRVYGAHANATMMARGTADPTAFPLYSSASYVTMAVDENGIASYTEFDTSGRPIAIRNGARVDPAGYDSPVVVTRQIEYWNPGADIDPLNPNLVRTRDLATVDGQAGTHSTATYLDGLGRKIQHASELGTMDVVSALVLDGMGQPWRTYRPYEVAMGANAHTYDREFADHSASAHPEAEGYPYSEQIYTEDPRQLEHEKSAPGAAFRLDGGHTVVSEHGLNDAGEVPDEPAKRYYRKRITNEDGRVTDEFRDSWDNLVYTERDPDVLAIGTQFNYDILGRLTTTTDALGQTCASTYDTRGREVSYTSPDAGTTHKKYDLKGRLRFVQDAVRSSVRNAVALGQQLSAGQVAEGSFELTQPAYVALTASVVQQQAPPDRIELVVKAASGAPLATVVAGNQSPQTVAASVWLPAGQYTYTAQSIAYGTTSFSLSCSSGYEFLYYKYDAFDHIVEIGEALQTAGAQFTDANAINQTFPVSSYRVLREFVYDVPQPGYGFGPQRNLRGRLSLARSYDDEGTVATDVYSYDENGRTEWCGTVTAGNATKVSQVYDWAGQVIEKHVVAGDATRAVHYYFTYDAIGRIVDVYSATGTDSTGASRVVDAHYEYTDEGQVRRLEIGSAQGLDYRYNARGWITGINSASIDPALDPGGDGLNGWPVDRFGLEIGYENIDSIGASQGVQPQYDGHASWSAYAIAGRLFQGASKYPQFQYLPTDQMGRTYQYDRVGRLAKADFGFRTETEPESTGMLWRSGVSYDEQELTYDAVGNMTHVKRYGSASAVIDNLVYSYGPTNNRLDHVDDSAGASLAAEDADDQVVGNYSYMNSGAMTSDLSHGIGLVVYDAFGQPAKMVHMDGSYSIMRYDAGGRRVHRTEMGAPASRYTYGIGGELAVVATSVLPEQVQFAMPGASPVGNHELRDELWSRHFYLRDEHGSVRMMVDDAGSPETSSDYFVYGGFMPGRHDAALEGHDPRFLGNEKEAGTGYDLMALRLYDSRIGRFCGVDPYARDFPGWSPYNYGLGDPVRHTDPSGGFTSAMNPAHDQETARLVEKYPQYPLIMVGVGVAAAVVGIAGPAIVAAAEMGLLTASATIFTRLPQGAQDLLARVPTATAPSRSGANGQGLIEGAPHSPNVVNQMSGGDFNFTNTVLNNLESRPYIQSPLTIREITRAGQPIADPGGVAGALRWDVPGAFNGASGTWELVLDPATSTVLHFLFKTGGK